MITIINVLQTAKAYDLEIEEINSMVRSYIERENYTIKNAVRDLILIDILQTNK